jgi:threonine dehydratase
MIPYNWVLEANTRLAGLIEKTPLTYDASEDIFIKWESCQITGSFKVRGAINRVLSMTEWELQQGLVAASAGNHGLGVAYAAQHTRTPATIYTPEDAAQIKIDGILKLGAEVKQVPGGYAAAERAAKLHAAVAGKTWVSPYNDGQIIAGQGTVALEVVEDYPDTACYCWIVPVGGGGLISGVAGCLAGVVPKPIVVGVQPVASPYFHHLFHFGQQENVPESRTLAEGLAGPIEQGSITIPIVRNVVRNIVLVSEAELVQAMAYAWEKYGEPMEPTGAAGLAAVLCGKVPDRPAVIIVSGGNITPAHHLSLVKAQEKSFHGAR